MLRGLREPVRNVEPRRPGAAYVAGLGRASGTFVTITPADDARDWYDCVRLLPDGTREIEWADPARGEQRTVTTGSLASIARDLFTSIAARD